LFKIKQKIKFKFFVHLRYFLEGGRPSQTTLLAYFNILLNNIFSIKKQKGFS